MTQTLQESSLSQLEVAERTRPDSEVSQLRIGVQPIPAPYQRLAEPWVQVPFDLFKPRVLHYAILEKNQSVTLNSLNSLFIYSVVNLIGLRT